jgi:hypothetical protein
MTKKSWSVGRPDSQSLSNRNVPGDSKLPIIIAYCKTTSYFIVDLMVYLAFMNFQVAPSLINLGLALTPAIATFSLVDTKRGVVRRSFWTAITLLLLLQFVLNFPWNQLGFKWIRYWSTRELALYTLPYAITFQCLRMSSTLNRQHTKSMNFLRNVMQELRQVKFFEQSLTLNVIRATTLSMLLIGVLTYSDKVTKFFVSRVIDFFAKL